MPDKAFNLLYENWIPVRLTDYSVREVSLLDIFENAPEYLDLACASPTENAALLRLLLAVTYTVVSRYDVEGSETELEDAEEALERWEAFWQLGKFPNQLFTAYLENYKERFWLFHPDLPFMQVNEASIGTQCSTGKLNPVLMESNNKTRLFSTILPYEVPLKDKDLKKYETSYSEAARGLLHINAFDDIALKPKGDQRGNPNRPKLTYGWVGELGLVYIVGHNLFETLMLNTCLIDENGELWEKNNPIWEHRPNTEQIKKVRFPDNQAELLTIQSRRLLLERDEKGRIISFRNLGGDILSSENAFEEQMTFWEKSKSNKKGKDTYFPKPFNPDRLIWRDFPALFFKKEDKQRPGVITWVMNLTDREILDCYGIIQYRFISAIYGPNRDFKDVYYDELSFYLDILEELDSTMQQMITDEIEKCEEVVKECVRLEKNIRMSDRAYSKESNNKDDEKYAHKTSEEIYSRLDQPFRQWLSSLQSGGLEVRKLPRVQWEDTIYDLALTYGRELVQAAGSQSLRGRTVTLKEGPGHYSSAEAFISFKRRLNKILKGQGI